MVVTVSFSQYNMKVLSKLLLFSIISCTKIIDYYSTILNFCKTIFTKSIGIVNKLSDVLLDFLIFIDL